MTEILTATTRSDLSLPPGGDAKKLSFAAVVVIACNTMNGPGLTTLPSMANAAGKITYCLLVLLAALATSFVVKRLCECMWQTTKLLHLVSQTDYAPRLEESDIVALSDKFFDMKKAASLAMVGCALSLALAQMMLCAAIADSMLVASIGYSCGLGIQGLFCASNLSMKVFQSSNESPVSLISPGLVISSGITVSLAAVDLDSMLTAQFVLFGCLLVSCARFAYTLHLPVAIDQPITLREEPDFWMGPRPYDAFGPVLFCFAFVVTAPPLSCAAKTSRGASWALITACCIMGILYVLIGWVGAATARASSQNEMDDNLLSLVLRGKDTEASIPQPLDIVAVILFGMSQLAAIPVYCELARETLVTHLQVSNKQHAFLASHVLPWTIVALTYNSALFEAFVEWSSLLLLGFANFSLPLVLDHRYKQSEEKMHHRKTGAGPDSVVWALSFITASIAAVIVQRVTDSLFLAEGTFMATTLTVLFYS